MDRMVVTTIRTTTWPTIRPTIRNMILGITGISGSGKHTAAQFFEQKKWKILDADSMVHHLYRPYTNAWKAVVREFGEEILNQDDTINRVKLGKIVFNASEPEEAKIALKRLNQIMHPYLKRKIKNEIHHFHRKNTPIIIIAALWEELDMPALCDKILLIESDSELASKRIQGRDDISPETYEIRVKNQTHPPKPDFIVENSGTMTDFRKKLARLPL